MEDESHSFYSGYIDSEIINNANFSDESEDDDEPYRFINSPPDPFSLYSRRTREKWVEDNSVSRCKKCKATFRVYRRVHHCILEGTPVTLSNGMSRKIEDIYPEQIVPSWNGENIEITTKHTDALFDQGYEKCEKITLEDGRELVATSDHEILAVIKNEDTPTYIKMKDLTKNHRVICSTLEGVLDDPSLDKDYIIPGTDLNSREKCLSFARLCGYCLTDGSIDGESNRIVFIMGDKDDVEAICQDIEILINIKINRPELKYTNVYRVEFSSSKLKKLFEICDVNVGNKVEQGMKIPNFMWDENCPQSIQREFIAGWFGGCRFAKRSLKSISVNRMNDVIKSFGISSIVTSEMGFNIKNMINFNKKIGFRYCISKQSKMTLWTSYKKREELQKITSSIKEFLEEVGFDWEKDSKWYYSLKIVSKEIYNKGKKHHVYDISVPVNTSFVANGILVHNCRSCGSSFCDFCTSYRDKIPKVIKKIPTKSGKEEPIDYNIPVRLCFECHNSYQNIHKLEKLFIIFSLIKLDLKDFKNIACVSKQWNMISAFYLSKFREIQYKLPKYSYNSWEKQALWSNRFILKNHSIWETHVLRSIEDKEKLDSAVNIYFPKNEEDFRKIPSESKMRETRRECWDRMCSRYCRNELDEERALLLLDISNNIVSREVSKTFDKCEDYILECYLPYILFRVEKNSILREFIFSRCVKSLRIANCCYWSLKNNSPNVLAELLEILPQNIYSTIIKGQNFVELVKNDKIIKGKMVSVVSPELGEQEIYIDKISIKDSSTRPTLIPCDKSSVLFKRDDIRKDYIIICIIRLMEKILKDNGLDINIVTYNVQPTSENEGFISIVENCETLYGISEKLKTTIINYLLKHNPDESVGKLRNRFKNSCAVYSVIAFLLSISDRNTENLLVTSSGDFFHIDYNYCLGFSEPKPIKSSCIRITTQMVEALGGENSKEYEEFKELCGIIYDILRRHINTFVCILSLIPNFKNSSNINEEEMFIELVKRFRPGETYEDAILNLNTRIDNSSSNSTLSKDHIIDFFHKHNKEKTITTFIGDAYIGTRTVLTSMYSYLYP